MKIKSLLIGFSLALIISHLTWPRTFNVNESYQGIIFNPNTQDVYAKSTVTMNGQLSNHNIFGGNLSAYFIIDTPDSNRPIVEDSLCHFKIKYHLNDMSVIRINPDKSLAFHSNKDFNMILIELPSNDSKAASQIFVGPAKSIDEALLIARRLTKDEPIYFNN